MTYRRHQMAIDYVNILMQLLMVYLAMTVVLYPFDSESPLHTLVILPAPYISYFIRRYTRHIWSFALLHLILAAIYVLPTKNIYYITIFAFYLLVLTGSSYYIKQRLQDRNNTSIFLLVYFILIYVLCHLLEFKELLSLCFWLATTFVLLFLLNMYLLNLDRFVRNHDHMVNVPFRQIKNTNHILIVFLCCLFLLSMLSFSRLPLGNLLAILGALLIKALRLFLIWLSRRRPPKSEPIAEELDYSWNKLHHAESSRLMEILSMIFQWLITIALIIGAVALILYTIYRIYRHFYMKGEDALQDEVKFISPFEKKEKLKKKPTKIDFNMFGRSNNIAIRRHFAKAVVANAGPELKLLKSLTPSELSEYAIDLRDDQSSSEEEDRKLITDCYEKARYSNEICSQADVRLIKKMLKGRKDRNTK